ncbi:MAG: hypothetical protein WCO07_00380 [bacterium]
MTEKNVLTLIKKGLIFNLLPGNIPPDRFMTKEEMIAIFDFFGAFWEYKGNPCPEKPHALLKSGLHSNGFVVCKDVLQHPRMCTLFANEIVKRILKDMSPRKIDVITSSAYSAIALGWEVARIIGNFHNPKVEYIPVEKDVDGNPTIIRGGIDSSKNVLVINELMTTGTGSTWETKQAVLNCNGVNSPPTVIDPAFVLVHRSKDYELPDNSSVRPMFHFDIRSFEPEECPYCKVGSEAIKPKIGNNWNLLHERV